ncbi:MAG TPA: DNA polymerase IV, partial [Afifellaceae bacterium]|nr:DNA polymerase IV [Afifellaceae bacterium]
ALLAGQPVSLIWGVGKVTQEQLARDGLRRIADLQRLDEAALTRRYGAMGLQLARLSRGEDDRRVVPPRSAKTISAETTFDADLADAQELLPILRNLSERVSARLKAQSLSGALVTLKLKSADFRLRTRNMRLAGRSNLADRIFACGRDLLERELDGTRYRLLGIGLGALGATEHGDTADLIDAGAAKRARAEEAMDRIRARYGADGLALGLTFVAKRKGTRES